MKTEIGNHYWASSVLPYVALGLIGVLILCSGFFVVYGLLGICIWAVCMMAPILYIANWFRCNSDREKQSARLSVVAVIALMLIMLGEYGASSNSSVMFFLSIWKIGFVGLGIFFVFRCPSASHEAFRRLLGFRYARPLLALVILIVVAVIVQLLVVPTASVKGSIRAITYYGTLVIALYLVLAIFNRSSAFGSVRTALRCVLAVLVLFGIFEMVTGLHLPTSIVNGADKNALATLSKVSETGVWIVATGPFYNPNNFCLFLSVLAFLSLPISGEGQKVSFGGMLLFYATLTLTAVLGSTIVSLGMLLLFAVWQILRPKAWRFKVFQLLLALACVFLFAGWFNSFIVFTVENWGIYRYVSVENRAVSAESVANDLALQWLNYENGGGSMWMRIVMYKDLISHIIDNPLGVGPGAIQSFLQMHPSASGLVDPHNWWLEFALAYGWVPFVAYLFFAGSFTFWMGRASLRARGTATLPIFIAFLMSCIGCISPSSCDFNTIVWLPVLLGLAALGLEVQAGKVSSGSRNEDDR